jgi:tol-pal system protein YbgF
MHFRTRCVAGFPAAILIAALAWPVAASAQDQRGGFLDNLFNRGDQAAQQRPAGQPPQLAQADNADISMRLDRLESALRQLTGTIEDLQHRNQQLEMRLQRMQDDTEYRFQQLGSKGGSAPPPRAMPQSAPGNAPLNTVPDQRSDVFDPNAHPNAPGAPRVLGNETAMAPPAANEQPVGAPGGRAAGAPLDLTTLNDTPQAAVPATGAAPSYGAPATAQPQPGQSRQPTPRNGAAPEQLATLPPTASPQDEYDMAYGYVLHKDYALAEQAFRDFLKRHPDERLVPDAQYWLGESLFQRQRYRDAAESFLVVSTKFAQAGKAPNALLRLGQSLAAMHQKEAACATLAEVGRKYPRAAASVKHGVAQELKRAHC